MKALALLPFILTLTASAGAVGLSGCQLAAFTQSPPASGGGSPAITNTTAGLANWWKFDENTGTTAADSKGSATGTLSTFGSTLPTWASGEINSALRFDGDGNQEAWVSLSSSTAAGAGAFTVSAWIFPIGDVQNGIITDYQQLTGKGFQFYPGGMIVAFDGITDCTREFDIALIPLSTWTHVLATWSGGLPAASITLYVNGAAVGSYNREIPGVGTHTANNGGGFPGLGLDASSIVFSGKIDDIRVWNRVLSAGEISNMYQWRGQP